MAPFDFELALLNKMTLGIRERSYVKSHEILYGKNLSDLHVKDPDFLQEVLSIDYSTLKTIYVPLLEKMLLDDPERMEILKKKKFYHEEELIINQDFNFVSQIERAF